MKFKTLLLSFLMLAFFTQNGMSQNEDVKKRKMTIVTKTVDKDGKETVTTIVKEGSDVTDEDIDKLIQQHIAEGSEINVEVEVESDDDHAAKHGKKHKKKIKIKEGKQVIEIDGDDDDSMIFISDDGEITKVKKDKDGKEKTIKIIRKKGGGEDVEIHMEGEDGHKNVWIDKDDPKGEYIIVEEVEVQTDKNGKTTKTVKKKRIKN